MQQTWGRVLKILERWTHLGEERASTGARLIGHVPHVAPIAYLHSIYPGLDESQIDELEALCQRPLPSAYRAFLRITNGAKLFSDDLSLDGLRTSYQRSVDASRLPYALETANTWERPKGSPQDAVFFGGYSFDGSRLAMRGGDDRVFYTPRREYQPILRTWPSFPAMLESEVQRLAALFDERGRFTVESAKALPVSPVPPRKWWQRRG
jgi:hypothetical protein